MATTKGKRGRERRGGQYGNTRGKPDVQLARRRSREETARFQEAQAAVQRAREELERRMAYERANPTPGRVLGATYAAQQAELAREAERSSRGVSEPRRPRVPLPTADAQGDGTWTMGQARSMLRAGYHLFHVQRLTGWGEKAFDDMRVDPDGFGLPIE